MYPRRYIGGLLAAAWVALAMPAAAQTNVLVFAAASMKEALDGVAAQWQRETGRKSVISYAASSALARQIGQGAPAQIFISAARLLGVPARYVSGHLSRQDGRHDQDAAHAWAEAWVEDLGWVGFDPANGICPTEHYVRVAVGLDAAEHLSNDGRQLRRALPGATGEKEEGIRLRIGAQGREPVAFAQDSDELGREQVSESRTLDERGDARFLRAHFHQLFMYIMVISARPRLACPDSNQDR